jgi:hypothetical protein
VVSVRVRVDTVVKVVGGCLWLAGAGSDVGTPKLHKSTLLLKNLVRALGGGSCRRLSAVLKLADVGRVIPKLVS